MDFYDLTSCWRDTSHDHSLPVRESDLGRYLSMAENIAATRSESVNALSIEITTMPSNVEALRDFIMPVASVYQSTELVHYLPRIHLSCMLDATALAVMLTIVQLMVGYINCQNSLRSNSRNTLGQSLCFS